jgi:hypothetical protein
MRCCVLQDLTEDAQFLDASWKSLRTLHIQELRGRWCLLCEFNHQLSHVLTHLDLTTMTSFYSTNLSPTPLPTSLPAPSSPAMRGRAASVSTTGRGAGSAASASASATATSSAFSSASKTFTRLICESSTRALILTSVKVGLTKKLL